MGSSLLTMQDLLRDTVFGRLLRRTSKGRFFRHDDQCHILALGKKYHHLSVQSSTSMLPLDDKSTPSAESPAECQNRPNLISLEKGGDNLLIEWSHNDPHNPRNWSSLKKIFVNFEICFLTVSVYIGSVNDRLNGLTRFATPNSLQDMPSASSSGLHLTLGLLVKARILKVRR